MTDEFLGPLFLYSTSMSPHERLMLASAARRAERPVHAPIRAVFVQASLPAPSAEELEKIRDHLDIDGVPVEVCDSGLHVRRDAYRTEVIERLRHADLVLLTGGSPDRAHKVMGGTPALTALRAASGMGAVIAGCSAGALLVGRGMLTGGRADPHPLSLWNWLPGVVVAPHYGQYDIGPWLSAFAGCAVLGIPDGGMALVLEGGRRVESLGPEALLIIRDRDGEPEQVSRGESASLVSV